MDGAPKFTYDFVMGQLRMTLVAGLAFAGGKGWLTPTDAGALLALATAFGPLAVPWMWSIMSNLGKVHIGSGSAAATVAKVEAMSPAAAINGAALAQNIAAKAAGAILLALALSFLLAPAPASAQGRRLDPIRAAADKIKSDLDNANGAIAQPAASQSQRDKLGCDPLNLKPGCKTAAASDTIKNITDAMSQPMKDFVTFVQGDTKTAIGLTTAFAALPDGNAQACFQQIKNSSDIITKLQATVDDGGTIGAVTAYEALRLLHMNLIKTCENKACTQIFNEVTNVVTAATPAPYNLGIPSITKLCATVPSIAMEPVTTPSPDPTQLPALPANPTTQQNTNAPQ